MNLEIDLVEKMFIGIRQFKEEVSKSKMFLNFT